jgi:hypothetical protein
VGDDYYLAGTTMHMNPAVEILHSKDLVNWNLDGYCTNRAGSRPGLSFGGGEIFMVMASGRRASASTRACFTFCLTSTEAASTSSVPNPFADRGRIP